MNIPDLDGVNCEKQYINFTFFKKGGMGEIYKGYDKFNDNDIALKIIPIESHDQEELLSREIKASENLSGSNIVKTHCTGKINLSSISYLYIVQSFYDNGNLRTLIKPNIDIDNCFAMMSDLLNGLQKAHEIIIHRDLKPENILIDNDNRLVITDFGLARFINEQTRTKSFKGAGTLPYMSPECWLFENNSVSMDIYSLGIIFFEILTGKLPFNGKTEIEWRDFHVYEQLPDISSLRPDTPVKLKQIISKMTQKRASHRYSTVDEIIESLKQALANHSSEKKETERLAAIGHESIQQIKALQLKQRQEEEKLNEYKKSINFHIEEVFSQFKSIVADVNSNMEESKINIMTIPYGGLLEMRKLKASFNGQSLSFSFSDIDLIDNHENSMREKHRNHQKRTHGMVLSAPNKSIFQKESIKYIGKLETDFEIPWLGGTFGFNLILIKKDSDLYGKWFVASFTNSSISRINRSSYPLSFDDFMHHFEMSLFSMHTLKVDFHELQTKDLISAVEHLLRKI